MLLVGFYYLSKRWFLSLLGLLVYRGSQTPAGGAGGSRAGWRAGQLIWPPGAAQLTVRGQRGEVRGRALLSSPVCSRGKGAAGEGV